MTFLRCFIATKEIVIVFQKDLGSYNFLGFHLFNFLTTGISFWGQKTLLQTPMMPYIAEVRKFENFLTVKKGRGPNSSGFYFINFLTSGINFWGQKTLLQTPIMTYKVKIKDFKKFPRPKKGVVKNGQKHPQGRLQELWRYTFWI